MARMVVCFMVWYSCMPALWSADRYGGIEIGAKGIKFAAIEVAGEKVTEIPVPKDSVNVTIAKLKGQQFDQWKIDDVASVVKGAKETMMTELGIPESNIRVVASSGVPSFASNQQALVDAIKLEAGLSLEKIGPTEEAALTNLALIPSSRRSDTMVIDIGSGNTKGGAFQNGSGQLKDFVPIDIKFGTSSLARRIDQRVSEGSQSVSQVGAEIARSEIGSALQTQVRLNPALSQRKQILFSGGSVWAMTTFMKPETALDPFPSISINDISAYKQMIQASLPGYPQVDFSTITNLDAQKLAKADYDRITGAGGSAVFKPEELFAGAILLEEVAKALDFQNRKVMFDRKAMTAWITAKITPERLRDQLPEALGRVLPSGPTPSLQPSPIANRPPSPAAVPPSSVHGTAPEMQAVQVWHDEVVYESRTLCYWAGAGCGWQTVCECVPVTRRVCETKWQPVAAATPAIQACNTFANQAADLRLWTNSQGQVSKTQLRPILATDSWVVFETPTKQLLSYPLNQLATQERERLAKQTDLLRSSKVVTDVTGQHRATLTWIKSTETVATYLKTNGKVIQVSFAKLSVEDRGLASGQTSRSPSYVALSK